MISQSVSADEDMSPRQFQVMARFQQTSALALPSTGTTYDSTTDAAAPITPGKTRAIDLGE